MYIFVRLISVPVVITLVCCVPVYLGNILCDLDIPGTINSFMYVIWASLFCKCGIFMMWDSRKCSVILPSQINVEKYPNITFKLNMESFSSCKICNYPTRQSLDLIKVKMKHDKYYLKQHRFSILQ